MSNATENTTLAIDEIRQRPTISIIEAGKVLGISQTHAYEMAKTGLLPTIALGTRRRRVPTAALLRMLQADA